MLQTPQAISLYDSVQAELTALIAHYKERLSDGLQIKDVWELVNDAIASAARVVQEAQSEFGGLTKREVVLHFAAQLYDEVIGPWDIPKIPNWIETRWIDPRVRDLYMMLVEGALNSFVKVANRTGWFDVPESPEQPAQPGDPVTPEPEAPAGFIPY